MAEFRITNPTELFLLQRALLEAKLPRLANDMDLAASPIVASLAERVTSACIETPNFPGANGVWRQLTPTHTYWPIAISRALVDHAYLGSADRIKQEEYVRQLFAPFQANNETVNLFIEELLAVIHERRWYHLWLRKTAPLHGGIALLRQRADGMFVALDPEGAEIASSKTLDDVGRELLERGLEPAGYYVAEK
jgi:hypothetical protein